MSWRKKPAWTYRSRVIVRSRCILERDGKILLQREKNGVYSVPGGRLEFLESLPFTVVREMKEEAGLEVEPVRLIYIVESLSERKKGPRHEILFYFFCNGGGEPRRKYATLTFEWRDPIEVADNFWPSGMAELISQDIPDFKRFLYVTYIDERLAFINTFTTLPQCISITAKLPVALSEEREGDAH
ncbi:MAG: NUDIX domain-containing protein [Desulfurococcales archaeon]|nr:NUDIX domain-containing protein [Desulfurococcales archaeon]